MNREDIKSLLKKYWHHHDNAGNGYEEFVLNESDAIELIAAAEKRACINLLEYIISQGRKHPEGDLTTLCEQLLNDIAANSDHTAGVS